MSTCQNLADRPPIQSVAQHARDAHDAPTTNMANAMVDLEELCALLSRSWPDAGLAPGSASTADDLSAKSSDTNDRGASTTAGADDFDRFGLMPSTIHNMWRTTRARRGR